MAGSKQDAFSRLVEDLSVVLEPCSGLKIDEIDPQIIEDLMSEYKSKQTEWMKYAIPDFGRCYTRNLVHDGNGKSNLVSYDSRNYRHIMLRTFLASSWSWFGPRAKDLRFTITLIRTA